MVHALTEPQDRLADLVSSLSLHSHPFGHLLEPVGQAMHGMDNVSKLGRDVRNLADALPNLVAKLVHLHDAGRDAILHFLNHALDVQGRDGGRIGQPARGVGNPTLRRGRQADGRDAARDIEAGVALDADGLQGDLLAAHALGVRNVFVVMGDPTSVGDYPDAMDNYEGGRTFGNFERRLPQTDDMGRRLKYREWDVNPLRPGVNRGPERLVTGSDGTAYYTDDHYSTFKKIRGSTP